jgi:hypothetical protein
MFPFCNLFKVQYNTFQGYVRLAKRKKQKIVFRKRIIGSMQNHDHSVEGDLANANSAQTVWYFFLFFNVIQNTHM